MLKTTMKNLFFATDDKRQEKIMTMFKISGPANKKLELRLEHPLHLDSKKNYSIGLVGLYGKHYVQNIPETMHFTLRVNDKVKWAHGDIRFKCIISSGNYSIELIEKVIMDNVKHHYPEAIKQDEERLYFIRVDPFTQKVELKLPVDINLFPVSSNDSMNIGYLLGFVPTKSPYFLPDRIHLAPFLPKLIPYSVIEIHCNLVKPTITNHDELPHSHQETDLLFMFCPDYQRFGSVLNLNPTRVLFIPINKSIKSIQTIELEIKNEEGKELNIGNENLVAYLKLIENDP